MLYLRAKRTLQSKILLNQMLNIYSSYLILEKIFKTAFYASIMIRFLTAKSCVFIVYIFVWRESVESCLNNIYPDE